jgi:hypothetical protein
MPHRVDREASGTVRESTTGAYAIRTQQLVQELDQARSADPDGHRAADNLDPD